MYMLYYQHILHVPDMNAFTHSLYVTIQVYDLMRSEYVWSSCYTCTICNVHVCVHFVCKIKFVLCSEVRICLLTLLYISCTWVMILTCWCLKQFYSYTCTSGFFCAWILLWLQIIVYWIKSDIHVLICPYFVLNSVLYILCYIVLFCFCKANNFSGDGVSYFPTSSAVVLWPFLVATPFV